MRRQLTVLMVVGIATALASAVLGRTATNVRGDLNNHTALSPAYCNVEHNVGNIALGISNDGTFGLGLAVSGSYIDCFTGEVIASCEFPIGSRSRYLFGAALWIGAVVGLDTLVSTGADGWARAGNEFHPDEPPSGNMIYRSTLYPDRPFSEGAVSHQDYIATYLDTCLNCRGVGYDPLDGRYHRPLNLEVTQRSYAWSYPHTENFVLIDYEIRNMGNEALSQMYLGLYVDADIYDLAFQSGGAQDDFSGFRSVQPATYFNPACPPDSDIVNLAWAADNDGGLGQVVFQVTPHITATRILRTPSDSLEVSFNWWVSNGDPQLDFGPQTRDGFRDFGTGGTGTPEGDRNKYYLLSNGELDYDQVRVATIGSDDSIWLPPPSGPVLWWAGLDTRYLLSCGPFDIEPGQSLPVALAYVAGENFHTDEDNFYNLPDNPDAWYEGVDFSDLSMNAIWAEWVYDNPGVDTDGDGYRGEFTICMTGESHDTVWRRGDGVPDYCATSPPPTPAFWLEPGERAIRVRWNGFKAETTIDWFSRSQDFEGYKAYLSTSGNPGSFSCLGSYDIEDYRRYFWDAVSLDWCLAPERLTIEEALCLYAPGGCDDPSWHPMDYSRRAPFVMPGHPDSMFYFDPILANASRFGLETPFVKRFPAAPRPEYSSPDEVPVDSVDVYLTDDGYFKYYEYEFLIEDLLPEQLYWITVTAFDCGSLLPGLVPVESEIAPQAKMAVPLTDPLCCMGIVGNADCDADEIVDIADVVVMIDYLYINRLPLCCPAEADVNQSGGNDAQLEDVTIGDIAILIDYLFITGPSLGLAECL